MCMSIKDVEGLRLAAAMRYQEGGVGEVHLLLPEGDVQTLATQFVGAKLMAAMGEFQDVFVDPAVSAS
jgi:hypothetical protein